MKIKTSPNFNKRTLCMKGEAAYSVLGKAKAIEALGKNIIHLEIGQPDFETPKSVAQEAINAIRAGKTKYVPPFGILELRSAIASEINKTRHVNISPQMVAVTPSAKLAIYLAMSAVLEPGDEVIYPNPGFPAYENIINFLGCIGRPVPLKENNNFSFDLNIFSRAINSKTKLVILNSPNNPTGGTISKKEMKAIAGLLEKSNSWVLSDEIYSKMIYDNEECASIYSEKNMIERTILIDGFSKTYAMSGWRIGYMALPEKFMPAMENLLVNSFACTAEFTQYAGIIALTKAEKEVKKMMQEFEKRRNFIVNGLNQIPGISCKKPQGAFYVFPNIKAIGRSSEELADYFLNKAGVALLPGTAFGQYGEGYLRISYANSLENIKEALKRIKEAIEKL